MKKFTNPLDHVKIASPCSADWNEMHGDARKRFCSACQLNVYNLSAMTRREAENLLMNSEGRLCVRFYRRADGTILTENCPVGWARIRQRVSRIATAAFSLVAGFLGGVFGFSQLTTIYQDSFERASVEESKNSDDKRFLIETAEISAGELVSTMGEPAFETGKALIDPTGFRDAARRQSARGKTGKGVWANGRVENISRLEDEPVELRVK